MRVTETSHFFPPIERGILIQILIDGQTIQAYEGELVSTVLLANGIKTFGRKASTGRVSGLYCGMGICYQCLVTIDGVTNVRACHTYVCDQMVIETDQVHP